jgi:hypothetical protein
MDWDGEYSVFGDELEAKPVRLVQGKSGGKPPFPTWSLLTGSFVLALKVFRQGSGLNSDQLVVRKWACPRSF